MTVSFNSVSEADSNSVMPQHEQVAKFIELISFPNRVTIKPER